MTAGELKPLFGQYVCQHTNPDAGLNGHRVIVGIDIQDLVQAGHVNDGAARSCVAVGGSTIGTHRAEWPVESRYWVQAAHQFFEIYRSDNSRTRGFPEFVLA